MKHQRRRIDNGVLSPINDFAMPTAPHLAGSLLLIALTVSLGCHPKPAPPLDFTGHLAQAHALDEWRAHPAIAGDFFLTLDGQPTLWLRFVHEFDTRRTRMTLEDGTVLIFDGQKAWIAPASASFTPVYPTLLTWPHFICLPLQLQDPAVQRTDLPPQILGGQPCPAARFTHPAFPDGWHLVYTDPQNHRLLAVAYPDGADSRAITFYDFQTVDGALIPTEWRLWKWHPEQGLYGRPLGSVKLLNLELTSPRKGAFTPPPDARECYDGQR